ncbi:uncharacterized protein [Acropora muricata]|uniref:uncharacterized protein n=1 Tax=Acropora muricata TaxID=159855 RepID=UPI0034E4D5C9
MASALPHFDPFNIHADSAIAQRWRKWIKRLENLFIAAAITDKKRQRALLLYYEGEEVCEIFETLAETGEDFATAKEKLTEYFDPKKNVEYEIYKFRQAKQNPGESMSAYHSCLRQLATTCEFADIDKEIKSQIILSCSSQRLRHKALRDITLTLETLLNEARALEISETQAKDIESSGNANAVLPKPVQKPPAKGNCYNCGESWPHDPTTGCPARNRKCNSCHKYGHYAKFCSSKKSPGDTRNSHKGKRLRGRRNFKGKPEQEQRIHQVEPDNGQHVTLSSSDGEYTFQLESKISKVLSGLWGQCTHRKFNKSKAFGVVLQSCDTKVYAFNSCDPLPVKGKFSAPVESKCSTVNAEFLVVESQTSLLGYATATKLGILQIANAVSVERNIFQRYPRLFTGLGKMKNVEIKLHIDESVNPVHQTHRRIPFHQRKSLDACVESLLREDIIEPAAGSLQLF